MIRDISGRRGSNSSKSVALQGLLASRLQALMPSTGSMEYTLTWKVRTTPLQRPICALRASVRRTSGSGFIGWVTPSSRDWKDTVGMAQQSGARKRLDQTPRQAAAAFSPCKGQAPEGALGISTMPFPARTAGVEYDPAHSLWLQGFPVEWLDCIR